MTKTARINDNTYTKIQNNYPRHRTDGLGQTSHGAVSLGKLLSIIWGSVLVIVLIIYILRSQHYPSSVTLLPQIISIPTLILALAYLAKETALFVKNRKDSNDDAAPKQDGNVKYPTNETIDLQDNEGLARSLTSGRSGQLDPKVQGVGLCITIGLAALYIVLLSILGFVLDSIIFVAAVPILLGQPTRKVLVLLVFGSLLVVILSIVVQLSGVIPLPVGIFGARIPSI